MTEGILLAVAAIGLFAGMAAALTAPRVWMAATLVGAGAAFAAAVTALLATGAAWEWQPGFVICGEPVHLRLDALSALFLALLSLGGAAGAVYTREYWSDAARIPDPRGPVGYGGARCCFPLASSLPRSTACIF